MKIEEFLESLPNNIVNGEDVNLSEISLREIFRLAGLGKNDVFYHLGCGDEVGVSIAIREFGVRKAVGVDNNHNKIVNAKRKADNNNTPAVFFCEDVRDSDISDATVILFWFADDKIIETMMKKFEDLAPHTKIVTIWGPLPGCMPHEVKFPYILNQTPFQKTGMQEQLLSVFGVKCIDFVTAWEFAERYTKSIAGTQTPNDRFLTIIQTLVIWINAKNLGISCGNTIPESIQTYMNIMHEHFGIDFKHLLNK